MLRLVFLLEAAAPTSPLMPSLDVIVAKAVQPCRSTARAIVVCGRPDGESPYRLPPAARDRGFQVDGPRDSVSRERHALMDVTGAGALHDACSPIGGVGATGCMVRRWRAQDEQAGFPAGVRVGPQ